jgi:hypothetical protein
MTNKVEEKRGRPAYKNGGKGGGWQRLSSQLASTFDRAIELHGGKEALALTLSEEISQRPLEAMRLLSTMMPKNIQHNVEVSPSDTLAAALSNVQLAISKQKEPEIIEADVIEVSPDDSPAE